MRTVAERGARNIARASKSFSTFFATNCNNKHFERFQQRSVLVLFQSMTQSYSVKENLSCSNRSRTCKLSIISSDAFQLNYRRVVGA